MFSSPGTVLLSSIGAAKRQARANLKNSWKPCPLLCGMKKAGDMEAAVQAYEEALRIHEPPGNTVQWLSGGS